MASGHAFHEVGVTGILFSPIRWCFVAPLLLCTLICAAWFLDWILVTRIWPDGIAHLQRAVAFELARAERVGELWSGYPAFARGVANGLYELLFGFTGIQDMGSRFAQNMPVSIPDTVLRNAYVSNYEAIEVAMIGTQLFGLRLAAVAMALPAFLGAYAVAVTDGLAGRAIRRAAGGRESASLYHRAKYLQFVVGVIVIAVCLVTPTSDIPDWPWQAAIAALAILARLQWAYYKKHL